MKSYTISQRNLCRGNRTWYGRINEDGSFRYVSLKTQRKSERVNATLKKAVSAAGLESVDATNHKFRHSFASNLVISGADDKAVQELMRHDDIRITLDTYSHLRDEHLFKAINRKATD